MTFAILLVSIVPSKWLIKKFHVLQNDHKPLQRYFMHDGQNTKLMRRKGTSVELSCCFILLEFSNNVGELIGTLHSM